MSNRKYFHDSVSELPPQPGSAAGRLMVAAVEAPHLTEQLTVHFGFEIPSASEAELEKRVAAGEQIPAQELDAKYGLKEADTAPLRDWLKKNGYSDIHESADHAGVFATASASTLASTLNVDFARVTKNGVTYTSARNAPSLPEEVSAKVHSISGLQPHKHLNKHRRYRAPVAFAAAEAAAKKQHPHSSPPYLPSAILTAFEGQGLGDGSGQTIAILIDTAAKDEDMQLFWQLAQVSTASRVTVINVNTTSLPPPEGEESLDTQWTSGIAPGAKINVYATGSLEFPALEAGLRKILADAKADPSLRIVSISLGLGELETPPAAIRTQHRLFLRLAALGVNVFVSTGDDGSVPNGELEVEYPASDPYVIAVGGTALHLNADLSISSQTGWSGSGGGKSVKFHRPAWQKAPGMAGGSARLTPDVAAPADPSTGALVVLNQKPQMIGGTSWSAPTWAGIMALVNQARAKSGKPLLGRLNPVLYPLVGRDGLRDVTSGQNGAYNCGSGHDLVTGLGSPRVQRLLNKLLEAP